MNNTLKSSRLLFTAFCVLLAAQAQAQRQVADNSSLSSDSAPPAETKDVALADNEVVILSPFEVQSSRDVGFVAASSLAGGRLAGDLKDTAAAYSVLTREFINALQIANLEEANQWTVNVSSAQDDGNNDLIARGVNFNSRGISAGSQYRDFFPSSFRPDSYNIERFDYARGPNAILFGPGGIGGTSNVVSKQAMLKKYASRVAFQYDSEDSKRVTGDFNVPVGNKLALRLNTLWQDQNGWRQNEFDKREAIDLRLMWQPTRTLSFTGHAEWGKIERNVALITITDMLTGWNGVHYQADRANTSRPNYSGSGVSATPLYQFVSAPGITGSVDVFNDYNQLSTRGSGQSSTIYVGGHLQGTTALNIANYGLLNALNVPDWDTRFYSIYNSPLASSPELSQTEKDQLAATQEFVRKLERNRSDFSTALDAANVFQDHRAFTFSGKWEPVRGRLFFEAGGDYLWQKWTNELTARTYMSQIYLDLSQTTVDGSPNPGFLTPFSQSYRQESVTETESKSFRVAGAYLLKNTKVGNFTFGINGGGNIQDSENSAHIYALVADDPGIYDDGRMWSTTSTTKISGVSMDPRIFYRYYWLYNTPGNRPISEPYTVNPNDAATITIAGAEHDFSPDWVVDPFRLSAISRGKLENYYINETLLWDLFNKKLNILAAMRYDKYKSVIRTPNPTIGHAAYIGWDGKTINYRPDAPSNYAELTADEQALYSAPAVNIDETTYAFGAVYHITDWLSVFGDYGTSFNTNGGGYDINYQVFAPRVSDGGDLGIRLNPWKGKAVINISAYRGVEKNQKIANNLGLSYAMNTVINQVLNLDPAANFGLTKVPQAYSDRRDLENQGIEIELTGNLRKGWRMTFNYAIPEAVQKNAFADTRAYLNRNMATLRDVAVSTGGVSIDANNYATAVTDTQINRDAASGWNNIQAFMGSAISGEQKVTRLPNYILNFYTDYTFQRGFLRYLTIGGGAQTRGREIIGNRGSDTIEDAEGNVIDDPNAGPTDYLYASSYCTATLALTYRIRLTRKLWLDLQARVTNLFDYDKPRYFSTIQRAPDGDITSKARVATPYGFYYIQPRTYTFTATMRF